MTRPGVDAGLAAQLLYLTQRIDDHIDRHGDDLRQAVRDAKRAPGVWVMTIANLILAGTALITLLVHLH